MRFIKRGLGAMLGMVLMVASMPMAFAKDFTVQLPVTESTAIPSLKDDFYLYTDGAWIKSAKIPKDDMSISDFTLVSDPQLRQFLDQIRPTLRPIFSTDFERQTWIVNEGDARIEVAIDLGHIRAGTRTRTRGRHVSGPSAGALAPIAHARARDATARTLPRGRRLPRPPAPRLRRAVNATAQHRRASCRAPPRRGDRGGRRRPL